MTEFGGLGGCQGVSKGVSLLDGVSEGYRSNNSVCRLTPIEARARLWPPSQRPQVVTEPASVKSVLEHLGLPAGPPAIAHARAPPLDDLDHTPAFDLTDPEPAPEYDFNQTVSC